MLHTVVAKPSDAALLKNRRELRRKWASFFSSLCTMTRCDMPTFWSKQFLSVLGTHKQCKGTWASSPRGARVRAAMQSLSATNKFSFIWRPNGGYQNGKVSVMTSDCQNACKLSLVTLFAETPCSSFLQTHFRFVYIVPWCAMILASVDQSELCPAWGPCPTQAWCPFPPAQCLLSQAESQVLTAALPRQQGEPSHHESVALSRLNHFDKWRGLDLSKKLLFINCIENYWKQHFVILGLHTTGNPNRVWIAPIAPVTTQHPGTVCRKLGGFCEMSKMKTSWVRTEIWQMIEDLNNAQERPTVCKSQWWVWVKLCCFIWQLSTSFALVTRVALSQWRGLVSARSATPPEVPMSARS